MISNELRSFRCCGCGRFLGFHHLVEGEVYLLCKNCKTWNVLLEGQVELSLTGQQIYDKLEKHAKGHLTSLPKSGKVLLEG